MKRPGSWLLAACLLAGAVACSGGEPADGALSIALNWKPEPEFGGLYEARRAGAFARRGLVVEITGGPGAPVVQMVASGQVAYGIAAADEVLMARDRGTDIVSVYATYQTNPQGIMVRASRGLGSLDELFDGEPGTLAVEPGLSYVQWFRNRYDLSRWRIVPYTYSIAPFLSDPKLAQQVFVTSEPIAVRREGVEPTVFLIADSGFDPYAAVVITRGDRVRERRREVDALVAALREGWRGYLDDPGPTNAEMGQLNREMDAETFRLAAAAQAPLVETAFTRTHGLGAMSLERWTQLGKQLRELALIDKEPVPQACFVVLEGGAR
ncbi:MAG: ABC transporter substrate-binding protein [Deltaproteobacteria bacterium]|nr:ABC transporter substrate-binding protein [Deltaproteobacteria bacterium]